MIGQSVSQLSPEREAKLRFAMDHWSDYRARASAINDQISGSIFVDNDGKRQMALGWQFMLKLENEAYAARGKSSNMIDAAESEGRLSREAAAKLRGLLNTAMKLRLLTIFGDIYPRRTFEFFL